MDRLKFRLVKLFFITMLSLFVKDGFSQGGGYPRNKRSIRLNWGNIDWSLPETIDKGGDGLFGLKGKVCVTFAYGIENIVPIGMPKLSYYVYEPIFNNFYGGIDINVFGTVGYSHQIGVTAGFQYKFISIENSISRTGFMAEKGFVNSWDTYNIKLGIEINHFLLRFGPSKILRTWGSPSIENDFKINDFHYNMEVSFVEYF